MKPKKVIFFFQLGQDLDVLLPALNHLRSLGHQIEILVKSGLFRSSPRTELLLRLRLPVLELTPQMAYLELFRSLKGCHVIITCSETNVGPHRDAYRLVKFGNLLRKKTITLQHGYENIGLTYSDKEFPANRIRFASQIILTWSKVLHPLTPIATKKKCISAGFPKSAQTQDPDLNPYSDYIAVFENLHWSRFSEDYRDKFIALLDRLALSFPERKILVKPHHAGKWLTSRYSGPRPDHQNLIILDPDTSEWEPLTAPAIIAKANRVISTPSSVCVDAHLLGKQVAVLNFDNQLTGYEFAAKCQSIEDVLEFVRGDRVHSVCSEILPHANFLKSLEGLIST